MNIGLRNKEKGFTIIEVVLVLAIAGLIFLIVFLALPQLQRSRRDTQRKNDVGRLLSALESYSGNNNGNYPTNQAETDLMVSGYLTTGGSVFRDPQSGAGNYTVTWANGAALPNTADTAIGTIYYRTGATCGTAEGTFTAGSTRDVSALTPLEGGIAFCQDNR